MRDRGRCDDSQLRLLAVGAVTGVTVYGSKECARPGRNGVSAGISEGRSGAGQTGRDAVTQRDVVFRVTTSQNYGV
ncbi:hypothetical protein JCM9533A_67060 [Catenuloplanes niger JCM 9533]